MKLSDIMRDLADLIDAKQHGQEHTDANPQIASVDYEPEDSAGSDAESDCGLAQQPDDVFIPPLQLKIELLKKATGVESVYDEDGEEDEIQHHYDDLAAIKRNAGIDASPVVLDALGDDEPLDV
jgi:hypothetical protein